MIQSSHYVAPNGLELDQADGKLKDPTASASGALRFNACTTTQVAELFFPSELKPAVYPRSETAHAAWEILLGVWSICRSVPSIPI